MKQTFSFEIENVSKGDVKLNGTKVVLTNEMSAEEITSVGGTYGKLVEAVAAVAATIQRLENGEPVQQNKNEDETPSDGAFTKSKEACKKAKTLKSEKKRGRKAAKKLEELLKEDNEDAQANAGWDTL
jgi:hypothetical protein